MNSKPQRSTPQPPEDARRIGKWARAYAQNRSLGMVVFLGVFVVLSFGVAAPSYFAGQAYRSGNVVLLWVCIAALILAVGAVVFSSVPRWGGKWMENVTRRIYAREGNVTLPIPQVEKRRRLAFPLMIGFGACILGCVVLGFLGVFPLEYQQPVSALYMVPFLIALVFLMRPAVGYLALLWPALYALHAILIVVGAPILFGGPWQSLNMLIPTVGYGMLSALVAHAYSRFALRRLRSLARTELAGGAVESEERQG